MDRGEAAALLGVPVDADSRTVRHAWRLWAREAHPDAGGNAVHFAELDMARRILLTARHVPLEPTARASLRSVLRRPDHPVLLALGALACLIAVVIDARVLATPSGLPSAVAPMPGPTLAALWAWWASRALLQPRADKGHRMTALALAWLPLWLMQVLLSTFTAASLLPILPISALPLAIAVSAVNPGAGLWRPVPRP
jgi:hypothetical protein